MLGPLSGQRSGHIAAQKNIDFFESQCQGGNNVARPLARKRPKIWLENGRVWGGQKGLVRRAAKGDLERRDRGEGLRGRGGDLEIRGVSFDGNVILS